MNKLYICLDVLDENGYTYIRNKSNEIVLKYKSRISKIALEYKNPDALKQRRKLKEKRLFIGAKNIMKEKLYKTKSLLNISKVLKSIQIN